MIEGSCHCGAVRFVLAERPQWLTRCNCSFCRRTGGLWAHGHIDEITLSYEPDAVIRYMWGDRTLSFISCKTCGCTTHYESADPKRHPRMAVNCTMARAPQIEGLRIRHFDGAESWCYLD